MLEQISPVTSDFDPYKLPPIEYLLNCIYTLDAEN